MADLVWKQADGLESDACSIFIGTKRVNTESIIEDAMSIITRRQIRAARALLGWSQEDLAKRSGVSLPSIKRIEPGDEPLGIRVDTLSKLQGTLEAAGIDFLFGPDGAGVRLRG